MLAGQNLLPRSLDRNPAEMHDALDAAEHRLDLRQIGKIGRDKLLVGCEIGRWADVAPAQIGIDFAQ